MEASGFLLRQPPCVTAASKIVDAPSCFSSPSACIPSRSSFSRVLIKDQSFVNSRVCLRPEKGCRISGSLDFVDQGHVEYYERHGFLRSGEKKGKKTVKMSNKKKLKLLEGLSKDLSLLSKMDFGGEALDLGIEEAAELLMNKLGRLRVEEELKEKEKEKANSKAAQMNNTMDDSESSSSSSSESSDSECGEMIDMRNQRNGAVSVTIDQLTAQSTVSQEETTSKLLAAPARHLERMVTDKPRGTSSIEVSNLESRIASEKRIEVCMGKKCQMGGGAALLDEFTKAVGEKGVVVGCKCMGKCKHGPNVRVCNSVDNSINDSVKTPLDPLCIGVGLDDIDLIVSRFLGEEMKEELGLSPVT